MSEVGDSIGEAIDAAGGAIPFERFMALALYGPGGFYTSGGQAGRRGDFITSPEVGPLFGQVLVRAIEDCWTRLDRPDGFTIVELGAGPGTLARAIRSTPGGDRWPYVAVEIATAQRSSHPAGVDSVATLADGPITGVVVANELLDNLPFGLAVFDGGWREAWVTRAGDGFAEVLSAPIDPVPAFLPPRAAHGARAPIHRAAADLVAALRRRLVAGRILAFDYCSARTGEVAAQPWRAWLRTYRGHERGGHYLTTPGAQDITTQVCLDQLPAADTVRTQAQFLQRWGIDELVDEGRRAWEAAAAAPTLAALRMRSRIAEAPALLDPHGLGGFLAVEWEAPPVGAGA